MSGGLHKNFDSVSRKEVDRLLNLFSGEKTHITSIDDFTGTKNCRVLFKGVISSVDFISDREVVLKPCEIREVIINNISVARFGQEFGFSIIAEI
ncbi:hypothetical protein KJ603_01455 [Patescibacteria group bacterium]|nr:hypothetical protein [Patescibacteria group bacterium]